MNSIPRSRSARRLRTRHRRRARRRAETGGAVDHGLIGDTSDMSFARAERERAPARRGALERERVRAGDDGWRGEPAVQMPYGSDSAASRRRPRALRRAHHPGHAAVRRPAARRLSAWQRHSEPGPAARAEAVVAPPGTNRPGCARSRQGTEFAESRFRASRVTFVRRQRPFRRSPRSRSSGCCSARAKRSSHRCRDKRCSVSSGPAASSVAIRACAAPDEAAADPQVAAATGVA